jgi:hypothetical protein
MALPLQSPDRPKPPIILTSECGAPGCRVTGDQYTMVSCRACGHWFCADHIDAASGATLVRLGAALSGLAYYRGLCASCRRAHPPVH